LALEAYLSRISCSHARPLCLVVMPLSGEEDDRGQDTGLRPPTAPEECTAEFLSSILEKEYAIPGLQLDCLSWRDLNVGALSRVVEINVRYTEVPEQSEMPQNFIAKFMRPNLPLVHMFEVESKFYNTLGKDELPFKIPRAIYTSSTLIIMERVSACRNFAAIAGCPASLLLQVCTLMARLHSCLWSIDCIGLASPAGIGSSLDGSSKERIFPKTWQEFLRGLSLAPGLLDRASEICKRLSGTRLCELHDAIHVTAPRTLIHGDFHVANLLFAEDVWLVDWGSCGEGCPLIDLAFFVIVSVAPDDRCVWEADMLSAYHSALGRPELPLPQCRKLYRQCIVNQFVVLVCYDTMSQQLASMSSFPEELLRHLAEVNLRACHALVDAFGEDLLPSEKTPGRNEDDLLPLENLVL